MTRLLLILIPGLFLLCACAEPAADDPVAVVPADQANLTLLVSNQSLVDRAVDLQVRIDGHLVTDDTFDVEGEEGAETLQHNVFWVHLRATPGAHEVVVTAKGGSVGASQTVLVDGPRWVSLAYWRDAEGEGSGEKAGWIQIEVSDQAMNIE